MSAPDPALARVRVAFVHPRVVPASLVAQARDLLAATGAASVAEADRRGPAGHVVTLRAEAPVRSGGTGDDTVAPLRDALRGPAMALGADLAVLTGPLAAGPPGIVVCDADSTFFAGEMIDELAERAGTRDLVAAVTARAMAGELDFATALHHRVATLAGLPAHALDEVAARMTPNPGAVELLARAHTAGARVGIVSGGFTQVLEPSMARLGIDNVAANDLEVLRGYLTGRVRGEVVDRPGKARQLRNWTERYGVPTAAVAAVGDGANDLDMLAVAGLGVAYAANEVVAQAADAVITSDRLDVLAEFLDLPA